MNMANEKIENTTINNKKEKKKMNILKGNGEKIITLLIRAIGLTTILPVIYILGYIVVKGIPALSLNFLTQMPEDGMRAGGIFPSIVGTLLLTMITIIFAVPFGVFTGVYLVEYSRDNWIRRVVNLTIVNLAGIPSIVYGLFGLALFVIGLGFGSAIISGALTLAIMCLPVIITATREALLALPNDLREASLALGATKWETTYKVILPAASPGILTGIILSVSRAAGETAPILFTVAAYYLPFLPESIWDQVMALPYHLYVISTQVAKMPKEVMDGTLFVLVFITVGFNLFGAFVRSKFRNRV